MTISRSTSLMPVFAVFSTLVFAAGCGEENEGDGEDRSAKSSSSDAALGTESNSSSQSSGGSPAGKTGTTADLSEAEMKIPDTPVSGSIAGQQFRPDRVEFDNQLTFRQGEDFLPDLAVTLFLFLDEGEEVSGKSWTFTGEREFRAPHVHLRFKEDGTGSPKTEIIMENYALKLQFGVADEKGRLPGRIFLQVRDEPGAKLAGTFKVEMPADLSKPPRAWDRPWVLTKIELPDDEQHSLTVGYVGKTNEGEWESNLAGTDVQVGEGGFASSTTYKPRVTTLGSNENMGVHGRHVRLSPGRYVFYVKEGDSYVHWKTADVSANTAAEVNFEIDTSDAGRLTVEAPGAKPNQRVEIMPLTSEGQPLLELDDPFDRHNLSRMIDAVMVNDRKAQFTGLAPSKFRVYLRDKSVDAEVATGKEAVVKFDSTD